MFEICAISDTGRVREHNEDCFLALGKVGTQLLHGERVPAPFLLAVADGMGGEAKGETAARMTLDLLAAFDDFHDPDALAAHITRIHEDLCAFARSNPDHAGMGAVLAGFVCSGDRIHTFHAGDSRVYRYRNGFLRPLTTDHSLVQMLYAAGEISREEMAAHPNKNIVVKALGAACDRPLDPEVDTVGREFRPGDVLLICSDGLSDMLSTEEMEEILGTPSPLSTRTKALIEAANARGGVDNVTVILCEGGEGGEC